MKHIRKLVFLEFYKCSLFVQVVLDIYGLRHSIKSFYGMWFIDKEHQEQSSDDVLA